MAYLGCQFLDTVLALGVPGNDIVNLLKRGVVPQVVVPPYGSLFQGDIFHNDVWQRPDSCWHASHWLEKLLSVPARDVVAGTG